MNTDEIELTMKMVEETIEEIENLAVYPWNYAEEYPEGHYLFEDLAYHSNMLLACEAELPDDLADRLDLTWCKAHDFARKYGEDL